MKKRLSFREDVTVQAGTLQVDRQAGIVKDVKILGLESKNGRRYLHEALARALPLYQESKCNLDHPDNAMASRRFADRFGRFRNVRLTPEGFRADFHYNPAHPFAETFVWWAENDPGAVGFSHNATGSGEPDADGTFIVSEIHEVHSIDLVADPATTNGLFEHTKPMKLKLKTFFEALQKLIAKQHPKRLWILKPVLESDYMDGDLPSDVEVPAEDADPAEALKNGFRAAILAILDDDTLDAAAKAKQIQKYLKAHEKLASSDEPTEEDDTDEPVEEEDECKDDDKKMESLLKLASKNGNVRWLLGQHDAFTVKESLAKKETRARKLCESAALPVELVTDVFVEQLVAAKDEKAMTRLIDDRRKLMASTKSKKPTSASAGGGDVSFDQFMAGLRGQ